MTTSDLWIDDLTGGRPLGQHGGLVSSASYIAWTLLDFIDAGRATANPDHFGVADLEADISGSLLIEVLTEAEKRNGQPLVERDERRSIDCVNPHHRYRVRFIEF